MRDKQISIEFLSRLKEILRLQKIDTFIDIIDNIRGTDHQKIIYDWLISADCLYLIETKETYNSEWVRKELDFASKFNIPIVKGKIQDIQRFVAYNMDMYLCDNKI